MKILITRSSERQTTGGAELSAHDQAVALHQLGHQAVFVSNNASLRNKLTRQGFKTYPSIYLQRFTPPLRYLFFFALFPVKILYDLLLVLIVSPDVINPHTREDQISLTFLKKLHRKPVVWKDPGDIIFVLNQTHGRFGSFYKKLYLSAAQRADGIYVLNKEDRQALSVALGGNQKPVIKAIPSSILYSDYTPEDLRMKLEVVFGTICRLTDVKNVGSVIRAYKNAGKALGKTNLLIVGDGPERKRLESLAQDDARIIFVGSTNNISPHLNKIDVFIHPALQEGWGRSVKEAMYFGKAIIGANVGGVAKQIDDGATGLLFDPHDTDKLSELMIKLFKDASLRTRLAKNAHEKALSDGDFVDIVRDEILPFYQTVIR